KFTEGAFRDCGYELAREEFGAELIDGGPWCKFKNPKTGREIVIKDSIADAFLQQILLRPAEYDVIATLNLNGDYISDALAAQVGGMVLLLVPPFQMLLVCSRPPTAPHPSTLAKTT